MKYITYTGTTLSVAGTVLLFLGLKANPYNYTYLIPGGILTLSGYIFITVSRTKEEKKQSSEYEHWRSGLIASGIQIQVELNQCILKSSPQMDESFEAISLSSSSYA